MCSPGMSSSHPAKHCKNWCRNIKMTNAQNGARIKAWAGPNVGGGIVKNVTFDGFVESKVDNPVVIDQVCNKIIIYSDLLNT